MKLKGYLLLLAAISIMLVGCRDNSAPAGSAKPGEEQVQSDEVPRVEFTKPALILVQGEADNYRIPNPKATEPFILRANDLSLEIAVVPQADLTFRLKDGKSTVIGRESLEGNRMVFFNGKEILLTSADDASTEIFDAFYKDLAGITGTQGETTEVTQVLKKNRNRSKTAGHASTAGHAFIGVDEEIRPGVSDPADGNTDKNGNAPVSGIPGRYAASVKTPVSGSSLINPVIVRNPATQSLIWPYTGFEVLLDNDLFSNTDRYYTNGVQLKYRSPAMAFWRINSILPVNMKKSMEYNSIELHHAMYTPFTTKTPPLLKDDRPYAATLFVKFTRRSESPEKGISQRASFDIGVIGEAALGSYLQKGVHAGLPTNDEPLGWETQIGNDIVLNYNYELIRQFVSTGPFSAYSIWTGSLGTLNTSAGTGIGIKLGNDHYLIASLPGTFANLRQAGNRWRYSFETAFTTRVVGYNATLTGGILNKNNIYALKPQEIERLLFIANATIRMKYGRYGISLAQYYLSNEFKEGKSHFWGQIGIDIGF